MMPRATGLLHWIKTTLHTEPFTTQRRRERRFRLILPRDIRVAGHVKFVGRRTGLVAIGVLPYLVLTPTEKQIEIIIE